MSYIYLITNLINNKQYVGKTVTSIPERYSKHLYSAFEEKDNCPIHCAMRKYGKDNFKVEEVEKCSIEILAKREQYWIAYYDTYDKGYNATIGGDGAQKYNYELIYQYFLEGKTQVEIAKLINCEKHTITRALRAYDVSVEDMQKGKYGNAKQKIYKIDKETGTILEIFSSMTEASKKENCSVSLISQICSGQKKNLNKTYTYIKGDKEKC